MRFHILTLSVLLLTLFSCSEPARHTGMHWLNGSWSAPAFDGMLHETWEQQGASLIVKFGHYTEQGDTLYSEMVRIDSLFGGVYLLAQPRGGHPVIFRRTQQTDSTMIFSNPGNRNPFEIVYRRLGPDRFVRTTTGLEGSDTVRNRFEFTRAGSALPANG